MSQRQADRSSESAEYATDPALSRRTLMGTMAAGAMAAGASPALAQSDGEPDYEGWFDNVDNYDGTVDARGQDEVTVDVGAEGNNGNFAFGPAAVMVSPGTTVVWEWTGLGSTHNVVQQDGVFDSGNAVDEEGKTFEHAFEEEGIYKYVCTPHEAMGMKGAVVVRSGEPTSGGSGTATESSAEGSSGGGEPDYEGWFDDVSNFDGTVDETGADEVTVGVGTEGNNGNFAFGPAAVRVSPGTTVVWEWTGKGSTHNVVEQDGEFDSGDPVDEEGKTFEHTFEEEGVYKYVCTPHEAMGMKGAVVVGGGGGGGAGGDGAASGDGGAAVSPGVLSLGGALAMAFLSPLAFAAYLSRRRDDSAVTAGADDPALPR